MQYKGDFGGFCEFLEIFGEFSEVFGKKWYRKVQTLTSCSALVHAACVTDIDKVFFTSFTAGC